MLLSAGAWVSGGAGSCAMHHAGDDEVIDWLLADEESIGAAPIEALRRGRKAEVRRVAQTLA